MAGLTIYIDDKDLKKAQNGIVVPPRNRSYGNFLNEIIDKEYYDFYDIPDPKKVESVNIQLDFLPMVENATNKGYNADTQTYSIYKSVEDPNSYDVGSGLKISRSANPELFNIINSQNGNNKYITKEQHDELLKRRVENDYENSKRIYNNHINNSFGVINAWDNLTPEERSLLMDYEYNSKGGLSQYPKFMTAMYKKDIDDLKKESKRYIVTQGKKLELGRNKHILNRIENIYNNRQQFGGPTHLQPWDEQRFRIWFNTLPEGIRNSNDYDYRGWWLENGSIPYKQILSGNGHFTDKYKLPNHPTFSNQSIYSKGNTIGGQWINNDMDFVPSPYNVRNGSDRIIDYMEFGDKGSKMFDTNGMLWINKKQDGGGTDNDLNEYLAKRAAEEQEQYFLQGSRNRTKPQEVIIPMEYNVKIDLNSSLKDANYYNEKIIKNISNETGIDYDTIKLALENNKIPEYFKNKYLKQIEEYNENKSTIEDIKKALDENCQFGPNCIATATSNHPIKSHYVTGNQTFFANPGKYGWKEVSKGEINPGGLIQIGKIPVHAVILDNTDNNGTMFVNYAPGGHDFDLYKKNKPLTEDYFDMDMSNNRYYNFVGNSQDSLRWTNEYNNFKESSKNITQNNKLGGPTGLTILIDDEQFKKGGQIHIKEKNKGKFTAKAKAAGMSVQEFARKVLTDKNKNKYSASTRRQANFARNASKWGK